MIHPTAFIHSDAKVSPEASIGENTKVWGGAQIMDGVQIGSDCSISGGCFIEGGAVIGSGVTIKNNVLIWNGVSIEDHVFIGPNVTFTNDLYPRSPRMPLAKERYSKPEHWLETTQVKKGASIGAGAVILCRLSIGEYATVAAGSLVSKDVAKHRLVMGHPAKVSHWVCRCGQILKSQCSTCGCDLQQLENPSI